MAKIVKDHQSLRAANENGPGSSVTKAPPAASFASITPAQLESLRPLIKALAQMAANDLSATTVCSEGR